jgi:hypothetical protein
MEQSDIRISDPEISATPVPQSHDIELETVKNGKENSSSKDAEALKVYQGRQPKQKKSVAFKLAFIGLSATLFVFQVDATALGIALPVRSSSSFVLVSPSLLYLYLYQTIANDLKSSGLESFWANLSYTLRGLVMQPAWASIPDAFGRKPPL